MESKLIKRHLKVRLNNFYYRFKIQKYSHDNDWFYKSLEENIFPFLKKMNFGEIYLYKFSEIQTHPDLYSSIYALLLYGLFNKLDSLTDKEKENWKNYILGFQDKDGLFKDPYLESTLSNKIDYWGWRHLTPHVITALDYLDSKPQYDFNFLYDTFEKISIEDWIQSLPWQKNYLSVSNTIMNYGLLLQYSRDYFNNNKADEYITRLRNYLKNNYRDNKSDLWGYNTTRSIFDISKAVKTFYHILPIFLYDKDIEEFDIEKVLSYTLKTQNSMGGFSPYYNSDACEDMDSVYILVNLSSTLDNINKESIEKALTKFLYLAPQNFNKDGGAVFKRGKAFQYADQPKLSSTKGQSNMFATWFRGLSIAFVLNFFDDRNFKFSNIGGYQYSNILKKRKK